MEADGDRDVELREEVGEEGGVEPPDRACTISGLKVHPSLAMRQVGWRREADYLSRHDKVDTSIYWVCIVKHFLNFDRSFFDRAWQQ